MLTGTHLKVNVDEEIGGMQELPLPKNLSGSWTPCMMNGYQMLFDHMRRFTTLTAEGENLLTSGLECRKIGRKEFLLHEEHVCTAYYFVVKGCLRLYRSTDGGLDQILQFGIPGWWLSDYQSFETRKPSEYNIQAVNDTEVLVLNRSDYERLFTALPELNPYFRLMMQKAYTASLKKIELLLCESAEDRYTQFTTDFPDFVQSVPQYMLASFLGFTPQFLSVLRAKKE